MKKRVIFLITAIIMFALLLSSCGNATPTRVSRWKQTAEWQELVYDVSAIDGTNSIAPQVSGYTQTEYRLGLYSALSEKDEIQPTAISGTYTTRMKRTSLTASTSDFESVLDIFITYSIARLIAGFEGKEAALTAFKQKLNDYNETHEGFAVITENTITVHTVVISRCTFYPDSLTSLSSERIVTGVYVGKSAQWVNDYSISCEYITENKKTYCEYTFKNNIGDLPQVFNRFKYASSDSAPAYDNNLFFLAPCLYEPAAVASGVNYSILEPLQKKDSEVIALSGYNNNTLTIGSLDIYKAAIYIAVKGRTQFAMVIDTQQKEYIDAGDRVNTYTPLMIQQDWLLFTLQEDYIPDEAQEEPAQ